MNTKELDVVVCEETEEARQERQQSYWNYIFLVRQKELEVE